MKKITWISLLLSVSLLLQSCAGNPQETMTEPVLQTVVPQTEITTVPTMPPQSQIPFGNVSILEGCRTIAGAIPLGGSDRMLETAQAVFVYETNTDTVIYAYNPDNKMAPGSLSKIMTALLAIELCEMDEEVTVSSRNISRLPAGSQNQNLKEGEILTVRDLLHCLLMYSANDAAIALAEHISGNQQGFVVLMNERAKDLGCTGTEFTNVHGLDNSVQYTTARDIARIVMAAMEHEAYREIMQTTGYTVPATNRSEERFFNTSNYLISEAVISKYYNYRVTSGMQSYAAASGASLAFTAEDKGMNLVFVLMGCYREFAANGWQVLSYGNFDEATVLMQHVLDNYKVNRILYDGQALEQFSVIDGESHVVGQPHVNYDTVLPKDATMDNLTRYYTTVGGGLTAPVSQDEMIATVQIRYRNSCIAEAELFAMSDVSSASDSGLTIQGTSTRTDGDMDGVLDVILTVCLVFLVPAAAYLGINAWRREQAKARRRKRRANRRRSY